MRLLIPRSAASTLGHIKLPPALGPVQFSPLPSLCPLPLAGSLPIHPQNLLPLFIPPIPPPSPPHQPIPPGHPPPSPTRPHSNTSRSTQPTGKHLPSTYSPPGLFLPPNRGPRVRMIQRSQRRFQPWHNY